jgi:multidrug resistance efflux pump
MDIISPKDAILVDIAVVDGTLVNAGDAVCKLSDDEETIALQRLSLAQSRLAIDQKLLAPDQVQLQRRMVEIAGEIAAKYVEFAQAKQEFEQKQFIAGAGDQLKVMQAGAALQKALGEQEKAGIALKTFDFNVQQAQERQQLALEQLPKETAFVNTMQNRLTVKAPKAGTIQLLGAKGSFLKKGQAIARIT